MWLSGTFFLAPKLSATIFSKEPKMLLGPMGTPADSSLLTGAAPPTDGEVGDVGVFLVSGDTEGVLAWACWATWAAAALWVNKRLKSAMEAAENLFLSVGPTQPRI